MRDPMWRMLSMAIFASMSLLLAQPGCAQQTHAAECASSVHAIILRGQGPGNDLNVMVNLQDMILQQIPGSTSLGLPYDHAGQNKFDDAYHGALMVQEYVTSYVKSCPRAKIALLGYSLGAVAVMDAICGTSSLLLTPVQPINSSYSKNVIAITLYGDETYVPLQPWNVGTCEIGAGLFPRLDPASCDPFAASIHSYCDYGDDQCCGPLPMDDNTAHHVYIKKYGQAVVTFIKDRYAETR